MLEIGTKAPNFSLPDENRNIHSLKDYKDKKIVLYFYPHDMTPGCTNQACNFKDLYPDFSEKGAIIIGISPDSIESHKKFKEKYNLPFILLSDIDKKVLNDYDVWKEKTMFGKKTMGVVRSTYLIDEEGIIIKAFSKVKPNENPKQMLNEIINIK